MRLAGRRSQITGKLAIRTNVTLASLSGTAGKRRGAARRGLGSNLYRLGVPDIVIQRILRHANVSTTATYYIKTAAVDVRSAMAKLESHIAKADRIQIGH